MRDPSLKLFRILHVVLLLSASVAVVVVTLASAVSNEDDDDDGVHSSNNLQALCPSVETAFASSVRPRVVNKDQGWGVYAERDVEEGEVILRVGVETMTYPGRSRRTSETVSDAEATIEAVRHDLAEVSEDADEMALALTLIADSGNDEPTYAGSVISMARDSLIDVDDDAIDHVIKPLIPELAYRYSTIRFLLKRTRAILGTRFPHITSLQSALDDHSKILEAALFAVTSRSFFLPIGAYGRREVAMVPCADLFNHEDDSKAVRFTVEEDGNVLVFRTRRRYRRGEELRIDYGDKSAEDLLFQYGFFLQQSNRTFVRVPLNDTVKEEISASPVKKVLFDRFTSRGTIRLTKDGLSGTELGLIRSLALSDEEMSSFHLANVLGRYHEVSPESETKAALLLEQAVFAELLRYKQVFTDNDDVVARLPGSVRELLLNNIRIMAAAWRRTAGK